LGKARKKFAFDFIGATFNGEDDDAGWTRNITAVIDPREQHGRCERCA